MENQYSFDAELFELIEPHPTLTFETDKVGIGYGKPETSFSDDNGPDKWNVVRRDKHADQVPVGNACTFLKNGIEFGGLTTGGDIVATTKKQFTLNDKAKKIKTNVTFSFELALQGRNTVGTNNMEIVLPGGLMMVWRVDESGKLMSPGEYYYRDERDHQGSFEVMGTSNIASSEFQNFQKIVMIYQGDKLKLWENDKLCFEKKIILGDAVSGAFGLRYNSLDITHGSGTVNMINFKALVGLTQPYVSRGRGNNSPSPAQKSKMRELADYANNNNLDGHASKIKDALKKKHVGVGSLFWGMHVDNELKKSVDEFQNSSVVKGLNDIIVQDPSLAASKKGPSLFFGIEANAAFFLSVGYSLGFLVSLDGSHRSIFVLIMNAGVETNAEVGVGFDFGIFPNSAPTDLKGFGVYTKVGFDTPLAGVGITANISGNYPMDTTNWSNCGPGISIDLGVNVLPITLGMGVSWTVEMFNLG